MADSARDLESRALRLPTKDRARLAERLISSLDAQVDRDADALWLAEAERRLQELESGEAQAVSADEVFEKARSTSR
jgi:putative addiction module component (TIGR02574 family)